MSEAPDAGSSSQGQQLFRYEPLHDNSNSIRLLEIERDHRRNSLRCTLRQINLDDAVKYTCLSYMWGATVAQHKILINGRAFFVRQSLMDFLYRARSHQICGSLLWIDAICINQDDHNERTAQVRNMSKIYRSAEGVIIYPGPCSNPMIIRIILRLYESVHRYHNKYYELNITRSITTYCRKKQIFAKLLEGHLKAFLTLPYWNRMWIVQEVILNQNAQVLCHNTLLSKFEFSGLPRPKYSDTAWWELCHGLEQRRDNLYGILGMFKERQCQVVNDRLYALLGMCIDVPAAFPIDYSRSAATVVLDTFQHFPLNQISDEFYTYYVVPRDYEYKMSLPQRILGAYPYILCEACFGKDQPDLVRAVPQLRETQSVPPKCLCPGSPLRYVFSLQPPRRDPSDPAVRPLNEKGVLGRCEGCQVNLHGCSMVTSIKTTRLSDTALVFQLEHPDSDAMEDMANRPKYRHQPRTIAAS